MNLKIHHRFFVPTSTHGIRKQTKVHLASSILSLSRRSIFTKGPRGQAGLSRAFLKWTVVGASGLAVVSSFAPHVLERRQKHTNPSPQQKRPNSLKNLIFLDSNEEGSVAKGKEKEKEGKDQPWNGLSFLRSSLSMDEVRSTLTSWSWPASFASIQEKSSALILELSRGPGSLFSQVVNDPPDPDVYPECQWDAEVRLGDALCVSERAFLRERKRKMRRAFARLFKVSESEVNERDLPIVAVAGSGGGFRAMVNTTGSLIGANRSGLLDCVTYMAGISGSCWALGVLYSGVAGDTTPEIVAEHIKERIKTSYVDVSALDMLTNPPTNKYLLSGILRKANGPKGKVSLVDLYGTLISARLFVPKDLAKLNPQCLSLHYFRRNVDNGSLPMPIFTAIHHGIPPALEKTLKDVQAREPQGVDPTRRRVFESEEEEIKELSSWIWFEFTPFEVGSDELGAWIPSWSLGRNFEGGKSVERSPEISFSILTGIYASAFCASLQHYFNEVQPTLRQLPTQLYGWLNDIVTENRREISVVHPVEPDELPNFVKGMTGQLRQNSPAHITETQTLGFLDAGAELNVPYYPLFRRDVDCIIALDASADSQDLWFTRAEQYAARRGISTWPKGARWPALVQSTDERPGVRETTRTSSQGSQTSSDAVNLALAEVQEREASDQAQIVGKNEDHRHAGVDASASSSDVGLRISSSSLPGKGREQKAQKNGLGSGVSSGTMSACTMWMGSSTGSQESSRLDDLEEQDLMACDGIAIVYNPLIPNDAVPEFDPLGVSTWSFSLETEETDKLLKVAEANFVEGQEKIVKLLRAIWLRKKIARERSERQEIERKQ